MAKSPKNNTASYDIASLAAALKPGVHPLHSEMGQLESQLKAERKKMSNAKQELESLVPVEMPYYPESYTKSIAAWSFGVSGVVLVLLLIFHCLIWVLKLVFNITWDTWGLTKSVFWIGVTISGSATLISFIIQHIRENNYYQQLDLYENYVKTNDELESQIRSHESQISKIKKQMEKLWSLRKQALVFATQSNLGIPINALGISTDDFAIVKDRYLKLIEMKEDTEKCVNLENRRKKMRFFFDEKMKFFYNVSIKSEVRDAMVYDEFSGQYIASVKGGVNMLRCDMDPKRSLGYEKIKSLGEFQRQLEDNTLEKYISDFRSIQQRNTSRFMIFTNVNKKQEQSSDMQDVVRAARNEYRELLTIQKDVSYILSFVRGCAYRNLYLGVELLNFVRSNSGGSSLSSVQDNVSLAKITETKMVHSSELKSSTMAAVSRELDSLSQKAEIFDNRAIQQFAYDNPKITAAVVAFELASSAVSVIGEHVSKVLNNSELQRDLAIEMRQIADSYMEGQAQMLRAIEIIQSIINANNGFMAIYQPLRKKVFESLDPSISYRDELVQLAVAMKEYNRISKSEIN